MIFAIPTIILGAVLLINVPSSNLQLFLVFSIMMSLGMSTLIDDPLPYADEIVTTAYGMEQIETKDTNEVEVDGNGNGNEVRIEVGNGVKVEVSNEAKVGGNGYVGFKQK